MDFIKLTVMKQRNPIIEETQSLHTCKMKSKPMLKYIRNILNIFTLNDREESLNLKWHFNVLRQNNSTEKLPKIYRKNI